MTTELTVLALAALLQVIQIMLYGVPANRQVGSDKLAGPRDEPVRVTGVPGRLKRAYENHFEGLALFTIAVVVVTLGGKSSGFTAACAWIYLIARVAYVPAYVFPMGALRSVIWAIGLFATVAMLIAALV